MANIISALTAHFSARFDGLMFDEASPPLADIALDMADTVPAVTSDQVALARSLTRAFAGLTPAQRLALISRELSGRIVFTLGFGIEGQLLFHWIAGQDLAIDVVTLDTGRLFPETYELWAKTEARYGRRIRAIYPEGRALEKLIARDGMNGFYDSVEARQACCDVRKVRPLDEALGGAQAWISGVRADQTETRRTAVFAQADSARQLIKVNPLLDWTRAQVLAEVTALDVPINALHARGFASIGCAPCTRALKPGEPERNGRWWWEAGGSRECGLHLPRKTA